MTMTALLDLLDALAEMSDPVEIREEYARCVQFEYSGTRPWSLSDEEFDQYKKAVRHRWDRMGRR